MLETTSLPVYQLPAPCPTAPALPVRTLPSAPAGQGDKGLPSRQRSALPARTCSRRCASQDVVAVPLLSFLPIPASLAGKRTTFPIQTHTRVLQAISLGAPHASSDIYGQASRGARQNSTLHVAEATNLARACLLLKYQPWGEVLTFCSSHSFQRVSKHPRVSSRATATAWTRRTCSSTLRHGLGRAWTSSCLDLECGAALHRHSECRKTAQMGLPGFCLIWKEGFRNKKTSLIAVAWKPMLVQHPWRGARDHSLQRHAGNRDF